MAWEHLMTDASSQTPVLPILCRVTPWYFRRMLMMTGMVAAFGLYFFYDGKFGYPKANQMADKKVWFEEVVLKSFDEAKATGKADVWVEHARQQGWPTGRDGEPPRWVSYAAEHGWPEKPHRYTQKTIDEQFWWGGGTSLVALILGLVILRNKNKVLTGHADHLISPEGAKVFYADVFRVDRRLWDNKGLAYVWHRPGGADQPAKVVIDDLKYEGAVRVLDLLMAQFKGELIDKVEPQENREEEAAPKPPGEA